MDFGRTMNQIVMETMMKLHPEDRKEMIPDGLTLPPKQQKKKVERFGQVPIPAHDFPA